jgi:hypothetical protein
VLCGVVLKCCVVWYDIKVLCGSGKVLKCCVVWYGIKVLCGVVRY